MKGVRRVVLGWFLDRIALPCCFCFSFPASTLQIASRVCSICSPGNTSFLRFFLIVIIRCFRRRSREKRFDFAGKLTPHVQKFHSEAFLKLGEFHLPLPVGFYWSGLSGFFILLFEYRGIDQRIHDIGEMFMNDRL